MAIFKSATFTQISGSIGGMTFTRNRGGMIARARAIPVNPSTPAQNIIRASMALFAARFSSVLTQVQRDAWDVYSENTPLTGPTGDPRNVGGMGMYIRTNVPRAQMVLPGVDDAPIIFNVGSFTPVNAPTATAVSDLIGFTFTNTDEWANEDDAAMAVYGARPHNPGVNYFTGPYQFAGTILGDAITPPTSPASITNPFVINVGQRLHWRVVVSRADGRLSATQLQTAIVA